MWYAKPQAFLIYLLAGPDIAIMNLVLQGEPHNRDAKLRLAEVYEMQNLPRKALALVYEGKLSNILLLNGRLTQL